MNIKRLNKILDSIIIDYEGPGRYKDILEEIERMKTEERRDAILDALFEIDDDELDEIVKEIMEEDEEETLH